jgi:hypothetical protein
MSKPKPISLSKLILLATGIWAGTLLIYLAGIIVAAASLEQAQTLTASTAAFIIVAAELLIACGSIGLVISRARGYKRTGARFVLMVVFALIQLGTGVAAALVTLMALNR